MGGNLAGDPGDMSWEDIVEASCVNGNPSTLSAAADRWRGVFRNADSVKDELDTIVKDLKDWKGKAGDDYRDHVTKVSTQIHDIETANKSKIVDLLDSCSTELKQLQSKMPIPAEMYDEVSWMHQEAIDRNAVASGGIITLAFPDSWKDKLYDNWISGIVGDVAGWVTDKFTEWFTNTEDEARNILSGTNNEYDNANIKAGNPTPNNVSLGTGDGNVDGTGTGSPTGAGGVPSTGSGGMPDTKTPDTKHPNPNVPNTDHPSDHPPSGTYPDPNKHHGIGSPNGGGGGGAGSGLAGAGGGGPTGAGAGVGGGGLGAGAGAGAGGGSPVGKPVSPGGFAGAGGAAGAAGGAMGRGMGGAHGGSGESHETWLTEDDDPWGGGEDSAPSVLGG